LETLADERRVTIAVLDTRAAALDTRILDAERDASRALTMAADRASALELAEREREFARGDLAQANAKRDQLQARIDELTRQLEDVEKSVRTVQRARNKLAQEIALKERELAAAAERESELVARMERQTLGHEAALSAADDKMEAMRSEQSLLQ